jgi:hypothetical protein
MNLIWVLLAIPLAALLYSAWVIGSEGPIHRITPLAHEKTSSDKNDSEGSPQRVT